MENMENAKVVDSKINFVSVAVVYIFGALEFRLRDVLKKLTKMQLLLKKNVLLVLIIQDIDRGQGPRSLCVINK